MEYSDIEKIDAHMHYSTNGLALLEQAVEDKFSMISINTDVPFFNSVQKQQSDILDVNSNRLGYIATFEMKNWGKPNWAENAIKQIQKGIDNGAIAIKFWKNIGMDLKDENGDFLMLDHPSFDPIFKYLVANNIPALGHLGEPKNCWLPLEEMTVDTDKAYFTAHPEYHMALLPEFPSYEAQMEARDNALRKHPNLVFVGAHLASLEWSTDRIGAWLDEFPNAAVDLAERVCHLQLQAKKDWQKVRDFMVKYQDRMMYGSDVIYDDKSDIAEIKVNAHKIWKSEWDFFATNKELTAHQFKGAFNGLALSDEILVKLFRTNTFKWYPKFKNVNCI